MSLPETPRQVAAHQLGRSVWTATFPERPEPEHAGLLKLGSRLQWTKDWFDGLRFTSDRGQQDRAAARLKQIQKAARMIRELAIQVERGQAFEDDLTVRIVRRHEVFSQGWPRRGLRKLEKLALAEIQKREKLRRRSTSAEDDLPGSNLERFIAGLAEAFETLPGERARIVNWGEQERNEVSPFQRFVSAACTFLDVKHPERTTIEKALSKRNSGLLSVRDVAETSTSRLRS